jgi:hypothetical protein
MNLNTGVITDVIASNLNIAAPVAAFLVAWLVYGILGKRFLGANDDFWPRIRRWLLPKIDALGQASGLYATGQMGTHERVGIVPKDIDVVEQYLETMGYHRNPLAAYKTSPQGWKSNGSWARRYGYIRGTGDVLRAMGRNSRRLPVDPRWLMGTLGRFLQGLGDVLALRQVHVTLFVQDRDDGQVVHVYGHDEPNSLNPLTALAHYQATTWNAAKGVRKARDDFQNNAVPLRTSGDR